MSRSARALEDRLRAELSGPRPPDGLATTVRAAILRTPQRRRLRFAIPPLLAAAALVLGGAVVAFVGSPPHPEVPPSPTEAQASLPESARPSTSISAPPPTLEASWKVIPDAPIAGRFRNSIVWTGREVLVWGGVPAPDHAGGLGDSRDRADGAAYDPARRSWRRLPQAPVGPRFGAVSTWTGRELLVWGGSWPWSDPVAISDGAAYDPVANAWRRLPAAPLGTGTSAGTWTGRELVVAGAVEDGIAEVAAYDPTTNAWRRLPDLSIDGDVVQLLWAADRVVAIGRPRDATPSGDIHVLEPDESAWRRAESALTPTAVTENAISIGDGIAFLVDVPGNTGAGPSVALLRYDPIQDTRRTSVPAPGGTGGDMVWTGSELLVLGPLVTAYDPASNTWQSVRAKVPLDLEAGAAVWAGDRVIRWSGTAGESVVAPRGGIELVLPK
jgi:hypothetical protein